MLVVFVATWIYLPPKQVSSNCCLTFLFKLRGEISSAFTRSTNGPRPGVLMWGSGTLPCMRIGGVASEFFKFNVEICVFGAFWQAEDGPF